MVDNQTDARMRAHLYALLGRVAECDATGRTKEQLKDAIMVEVSGQTHWQGATFDQRLEAIDKAARMHLAALDKMAETAPVEDVARYSLSELIQAVLTATEKDVTPTWGEYVGLWKETSDRLDYLKWVRAAVAYTISAIPEDAAGRIAATDFAREVGISPIAIRHLSRLYELFGLDTIRQGVPFDVCSIIAQSREPMRLLAIYQQEGLSMLALKRHIAAESGQGAAETD